nr:MAG TPA: hypothetical protein [Caudoviricetes sp.]
MKDKTFLILLTVIWLSMGGVYLLAADVKQDNKTQCICK